MAKRKSVFKQLNSLKISELTKIEALQWAGGAPSTELALFSFKKLQTIIERGSLRNAFNEWHIRSAILSPGKLDLNFFGHTSPYNFGGQVLSQPQGWGNKDPLLAYKNTFKVGSPEASKSSKSSIQSDDSVKHLTNEGVPADPINIIESPEKKASCAITFKVDSTQQNQSQRPLQLDVAQSMYASSHSSLESSKGEKSSKKPMKEDLTLAPSKHNQVGENQLRENFFQPSSESMYAYAQHQSIEPSQVGKMPSQPSRNETPSSSINNSMQPNHSNEMSLLPSGSIADSALQNNGERSLINQATQLLSPPLPVREHVSPLGLADAGQAISNRLQFPLNYVEETKEQDLDTTKKNIYLPLSSSIDRSALNETIRTYPTYKPPEKTFANIYEEEQKRFEYLKLLDQAPNNLDYARGDSSLALSLSRQAYSDPGMVGKKGQNLTGIAAHGSNDIKRTASAPPLSRIQNNSNFAITEHAINLPLFNLLDEDPELKNQRETQGKSITFVEKLAPIVYKRLKQVLEKIKQGTWVGIQVCENEIIGPSGLGDPKFLNKSRLKPRQHVRINMFKLMGCEPIKTDEANIKGINWVHHEFKATSKLLTWIDQLIARGLIGNKVEFKVELGLDNYMALWRYPKHEYRKKILALDDPISFVGKKGRLKMMLMLDGAIILPNWKVKVDSWLVNYWQEARYNLYEASKCLNKIMLNRPKDFILPTDNLMLSPKETHKRIYERMLRYGFNKIIHTKNYIHLCVNKVGYLTNTFSYAEVNSKNFPRYEKFLLNWDRFGRRNEDNIEEVEVEGKTYFHTVYKAGPGAVELLDEVIKQGWPLKGSRWEEVSAIHMIKQSGNYIITAYQPDIVSLLEQGRPIGIVGRKGEKNCMLFLETLKNSLASLRTTPWYDIAHKFYKEEEVLKEKANKVFVPLVEKAETRLKLALRAVFHHWCQVSKGGVQQHMNT